VLVRKWDGGDEWGLSAIDAEFEERQGGWDGEEIELEL
jgi:hypothetical protein